MYSTAVFPGRYRACGVRLLPLTLGHALLLDRLDNPFGSHSLLDPKAKLPTFGDLLLAVFIVSRPWRRAERQVDTPWVRWWTAWKLTTCRWSVARDSDSVMAWHKANWRCPRMRSIRTEDGTGPERGAELLNVLTVFACKHLNCTPQTALDLRVAQLQYDFACHAEESGVVQIVDAEDDLLMRLAIQDEQEREAARV